MQGSATGRSLGWQAGLAWAGPLPEGPGFRQSCSFLMATSTSCLGLPSGPAGSLRRVPWVSRWTGTSRPGVSLSNREVSLHSMESGSEPSSPGPDALLGVKGQGGRHWFNSSWPTFRKSLPRGWGMAKMGRLWQEWGGSRSGVKPCVKKSSCSRWSRLGRSAGLSANRRAIRRQALGDRWAGSG